MKSEYTGPAVRKDPLADLNQFHDHGKNETLGDDAAPFVHSWNCTPPGSCRTAVTLPCTPTSPCDNLTNCPVHLAGIRGISLREGAGVPRICWRSSVGRASDL